jgi:hypothetical protein
MKIAIKQILRENLITEITVSDAWSKFYSDVNKFPLLKGDINLFNELNDLYPRRGENFNKGYFTWLYNLIKNNRLKNEDFYKVKEYLRLFDKFINQIPNEFRDINKFKNINDLYDVVKQFEGGEDEISTSKTSEIKDIKKNEVEKVFENSGWLIMIPKTERASCLIGKGTKWCTAADQSNNMFDHYNEDGPLYVMVDKYNEAKYQLHFESGQLMDADDREVSVTYFFDHIVEDSAVFDFLQSRYDKFWDFILKNSVDDIASGGYSETFEEALTSDVTPSVLERTLETLRNGEDTHSVYLGFVYEKNPNNINKYDVLRLFDSNGFNNPDEDDIEAIFSHLTNIEYDFDDVGDENVTNFNNAKIELEKHKLKVGSTYNTDKDRTIKINKINFGDDVNGEYNVTMDGKTGDIDLESLLNYIHMGQLFERLKNRI